MGAILYVSPKELDGVKRDYTHGATRYIIDGIIYAYNMRLSSFGRIALEQVCHWDEMQASEFDGCGTCHGCASEVSHE